MHIYIKLDIKRQVDLLVLFEVKRKTAMFSCRITASRQRLFMLRVAVCHTPLSYRNFMTAVRYRAVIVFINMDGFNDY